MFTFAPAHCLVPITRSNHNVHRWHAFVDEDDPTNDYINSTTVVNGLNFTLNEEYHVVHHQYAGAHWDKCV